MCYSLFIKYTMKGDQNMTNTKLFKAMFALSGKYEYQGQLAKDLGISGQSLSNKIRNSRDSKFTTDEIKKIIDIFELSNDDVVNIFFA